MGRIAPVTAALALWASAAWAHGDGGGNGNGDAGPTVTPIMTHALPETAGKHVSIATVAYEPGQASDAHRHPGSIVAYVLEGHVVSQLEGSAAKAYGPGESWYEPPGAHHVVSRNASGELPAKLLVFAILSPGEPLKQPIMQPLKQPIPH